MKTFTLILSGIFFLNICTGQDSITGKNSPDMVFLNKQDNLTEQKILNVADASPAISTTSTPAGSSEIAAVRSPYKTSWVTDGLIIAGTIGTTFIGYELIENKKDLTLAELATKTRDKLPFFDRGNAGYYSDRANKDSYILFDAAYALPAIAALIDKDQRSKFGQLMALYVETIGITGAMYTMAAGLIYRSRPFVYGDIAPLGKRVDKSGQRSFYGGHVAAVAASTFFIAKVNHDFHPHSKVQPYLVGGAIGLTALMGYWRYKAGYHFLSDCVLSFIMGSATGILIPQWHKSKMSQKISLHAAGNGQGIGFVYHLK